MESDKIFEKIDQLEPRELENCGVIALANSSEKVNGYPTYVCLQCGNGSHSTKSMGMTVKKYDWGYNYWCHRCGNFTATKLLEQKVGNLEKVIEWYKNHFFSFNGKKIFFEDSVENSEKVVSKKIFSKNEGGGEKIDYSNLYKNSGLRLKNFMKKNGLWRKLEIGDFEKVGAGIATEEELKNCGEKVEGECFIFPFNENHFFMRSVIGKVKRGNTGGSKEIYDRLIEKKDCKEIIAVEGIIDCLSIHKATGLAVVAVDGAGNFKNLKEWTEKFFSFSTPKFILLGDNNDNGAGQVGALVGVEKLRGAGFLAVSKILSPKKKYDANEFLQREGKEKLAARIFEIVEEARSEMEKFELEKKNKK